MNRDSESDNSSVRGEESVDGPPAGDNAEQVVSSRMADPVVDINGVFKEQPLQDDTGQFAPAESPPVDGELEQTPLMPENQGSQVPDATRVELKTDAEKYMKAMMPKAESKIDVSTGSSLFNNANNYGDATSPTCIDHNEDSKGIRSLEASRHLEAIKQGNALPILTTKETNHMFALKTAERMQPEPPPLKQPVGQPKGPLPTLKVTISGIASTWSREQLLSYSPEIALQFALPKQIVIHLGDHFPDLYLNLDKNGYSKLSTADINHPMIARLIESHLNQEAPGAQHPLVASLINSLTDSIRSPELRHSGPPGC